MRVLVVHNHYQEYGGEDVAFAQEVDLLREHGHEVRAVELDNAAIKPGGIGARVRLFAGSVWSRSRFAGTRRLIRAFRPDVVHVHNWLPLVSPSVFHAAWAEDVPVVHTLHNYRLICPAATLYRQGRVCEECVGRPPWAGVAHACYRGSRQASLAVAAALELHRALKTWQRIDAYIAVSDFVRRKVLAGGLPADRVYVKPNFVAPQGPVRDGAGSFALYAGRLTSEKGLRTLVEAWAVPEGAGQRGLPLKIVGRGPIEHELQGAARASGASVQFVGVRPRSEIAQLLAEARFLVAPSEWHEPLSMSAIEALACGVPILASAAGGFTELIRDGVTGLHFRPGDAVDLAHAARQLAEDLPGNIEMGQAARREYLARYTPDRNYRQLIDIYQRAGATRHGELR